MRPHTCLILRHIHAYTLTRGAPQVIETALAADHKTVMDVSASLTRVAVVCVTGADNYVYIYGGMWYAYIY
jgi:hypothetical protein